jgi:hypothetical protein
MTRERPIPHPPQNQHFHEFAELLILNEIKSSRINTSKKYAISPIMLIAKDFNSTRINTSGAKDLKSLRINTSGNKDLKSNHFSTSKKQGRGVACVFREKCSGHFRTGSGLLRGARRNAGAIGLRCARAERDARRRMR